MIKRFQSLQLRNNSRLNGLVSSLEAIVDLAASTPGVVHLIDGQTDDPILNIVAASERKDDGVEVR